MHKHMSLKHLNLGLDLGLLEIYISGVTISNAIVSNQTTLHN